MNLQIVFGSCGGFRKKYNQIEIDLENVDVDSLLDGIGQDYVKRHFGLFELDELDYHPGD